MGENQGTLAPDAVKAEMIRLAESAGTVQTYAGELLRVYGFKIIHDTFPGYVTREHWNRIMGIRTEQGITDRDFLRQHGRPVCCPDCDRERAEALRRELGHAAAPVDETEEEEAACDHENVTECEQCGGSLDRNCEHSFYCDECNRDRDSCADCGAERDCGHVVTCNDCGARLSEPSEYDDLVVL